MKTNLLLTAALSLSLCAASMAQTLPAYLPTDGLVGWWPFNGNANDESGNGNNGTVNGATLTVDRNGNGNNAYYFNGSNFIDCGASTEMVMTNNLTLSCWGKTSNQFPNHCIAGRWSNVSFDPAPFGTPEYCLVFDNTSVTSAIVISTPPNEYVSAPISYYDNEWHLYTMTYDGVTNKIFIDGNLTSQAAFSGSIQSFVNKFVIGTYGLGGYPELPNSWIGDIDDVGLWNRALTPEEITSLYTGEPLNPPTACNPLPSNLQNGLVGYWPFCGNANDESGNGNNGTVNGATLTEDRFGVANAAYDFDGVDDFIESNGSFSQASNQKSLSVWFNSNNINYNWLVSGGNDFPCQAFGLYQDTSHYVGAFDYDLFFFGNGLNCDHSFSDFENNSWNHAVITYDGLSVNTYLNGLFVSSRDVGLETTPNMGITFGGRGDGTAFYNGSLDDIGIWNRALSPEEVQQLYTLNACTYTIYDTVTVTQTVYDTVTTYTTVTDTLIINTLITELAPPANTNTIKVFPNPAGSTLTIDYGNYALMNGYQLRIENSLGQEVFQTNINQQSDTLSLGSWGGNGLYFVHIVDPQGNTVDIRKIVLQ